MASGQWHEGSSVALDPTCDCLQARVRTRTRAFRTRDNASKAGISEVVYVLAAFNACMIDSDYLAFTTCDFMSKLRSTIRSI